MKRIAAVATGWIVASLGSAAAPTQQVPAQNTAPVAPAPEQPAAYPGVFYNTTNLYQAHSQTAQLAQQYVKATKEEDKRDIRKKLGDLLGQQFDQHTQQQQKELEELEKQIAHLRSVLKKRQDAKGTIVERRLDQLIQDAEGLGWTAPGSPRQGLAPVGAPATFNRPRSE
jgi:hypothetical protein